MRRAPKRLWMVVALFCFAGILKATLPQIGIGNWTAASNLSQARSHASSLLLPDGRILFIGGDGGSGPVQSVDIFGTDGTVSSAAALNVARSRQFAVVLDDGRVLVGGGTTTGGGTTNSAEIYDPSANTWTATNAMTSARANASAAVLQDGRVLIAGGDNAGAPSNTLEIFDPASGNFSFAGTMSASRTQQTMAVLQDGRVLIVGGTDGTNPLASSDFFDPSSGNVSAGPNLTTARYAAAATTLLNGQVAVIGGAGSDGNGGTTDLGSIEIFDSSSGAFKSAGASLASAREGHQAFLLPNNNNVLITGGISSGTALASSELFTAQASSADGSWTYAVSTTGAMNAARASAAGSANQLNGPTSKVTPKPGLVVVGGGTDTSGNTLASTEAYGYPTVQTDQGDYPPGTTVNIVGSGFQPNETVTITLVESPLFDTHGPYTVTADGNGNISDSSFTTDVHDVNVRFWLSAVGSQSGLVAQNAFTDGNVTSLSGTVKSAAAGNPAIVGATITCTSGCNNSPAASTTSGTAGAYIFDGKPGDGPKLSFATNGPVTLQLTASATGFNSSTITINNVTNQSSFTNEDFTLTPATIANTITTSPAGLQVSVDGGAAQTTPVIVNWTPGSNHTIATTSPQANGSTSQFVWTSWSDDLAISHSVTAPSTSTTYTANFKTQYQLTFAATGLGGDTSGTIVTVNGSQQSTVPYQAFFDSGSVVTYSYSSPVASTVTGKQYVLTTPAPSPASPITVSAAATVIAAYKTQWQLTFAQSGIGADGTGTIVTVNGSGQSTLPYQAFFDAGSGVTYAYSDPVASTTAGKRYALTTPAPTPGSPITVSAAVTVTGIYKVAAYVHAERHWGRRNRYDRDGQRKCSEYAAISSLLRRR